MLIICINVSVWSCYTVQKDIVFLSEKYLVSLLLKAMHYNTALLHKKVNKIVMHYIAFYHLGWACLFVFNNKNSSVIFLATVKALSHHKCASAFTPDFSQHGDRRAVSHWMGKQSNLHYLLEKVTYISFGNVKVKLLEQSNSINVLPPNTVYIFNINKIRNPL